MNGCGYAIEQLGTLLRPTNWQRLVRRLPHSAHHLRACEQSSCTSFDSMSIGCQISSPSMALHERWPDSRLKGVRPSAAHGPNWSPPDLDRHVMRKDGGSPTIGQHCCTNNHRCFNSFKLDRTTGPHGVRMNGINPAMEATLKRRKGQHPPCATALLLPMCQ